MYVAEQVFCSLGICQGVLQEDNRFIFTFLRILHTNFHSLQYHQEWMQIIFPPKTFQYLFLLDFFYLCYCENVKPQSCFDLHFLNSRSSEPFRHVSYFVLYFFFLLRTLFSGLRPSFLIGHSFILLLLVLFIIYTVS